MLSFLLIAVLSTAVFARPAPMPQVSAPPFFTDPTCSLPTAQDTLGYPSDYRLFPTATTLGTILGPVLVKAIGTQGVIAIDQIAEDLCVNANQNPLDDVGLCDNILNFVFQFATFQGGAAATQYACLLNALCIAPPSPQNEGTCQYLLAGADCVANRLIGVDVPECVGEYPPS